MCHAETSVYACGHTVQALTRCSESIQSQGRDCYGPTSDTGYENHIKTYCADCARWKWTKKKKADKLSEETAVLIPDRVKKWPEDPNCGNPKDKVVEKKEGCEVM